MNGVHDMGACRTWAPFNTRKTSLSSTRPERGECMR
jgi:hypothetical protein